MLELALVCTSAVSVMALGIAYYLHSLNKELHRDYEQACDEIARMGALLHKLQHNQDDEEDNYV